MIKQKLRTFFLYAGLLAFLAGLLGVSGYLMGVQPPDAVLSENTCPEQREGIYTTQVRVSSVEVTQRGLETKIIHVKSEPVKRQSIKLKQDGQVVASKNRSFTLGVGRSRLKRFPQFRPTDECREYIMEIDYQRGDIKDLRSNGELRAAATTVQN